MAMRIFMSLLICHLPPKCDILTAVVSKFLKELEKSDPTRQPPPDWYFWPGVALMFFGVIFAICKVASLYH